MIMQVCIVLAAVCLVRVDAQATNSIRSATMTFNNYNPGYKNCKVYIANIVVFDCGLQYNAYQLSYLFRNAQDDYSIGYSGNKLSDIQYYLRRLIDSNQPDGEGDFFMLKQGNQFNTNNVITQIRPISGNGVNEITFLTYNFQNKKVIDYVMFIKRTTEGDRLYFTVFMTDQKDLLLVKHIQGDPRVYSDSDIKGTISLDNSLRHIRGYYRRQPINVDQPDDGFTIEYGFIIIEEEDNGIQHMRRVVLTLDEEQEYEPSMELVGVETIGADKVAQLEVNNKFICVSQPSLNTIKFYQIVNLQEALQVTRQNSEIGQSMTLRRKIMPNGLEMHRLYFSQKRLTEDGLNQWIISLEQIFLEDEYSYSEASQPLEQDDAFVFPAKTVDDEVSESLSFSVWRQRLIGISNEDIYFDLASICQADQFWLQQEHPDNDFCPSCPSETYSKYQFTLGLQPTSCITCQTWDQSRTDVTTFLLNKKAPTCEELLEQERIDEANKPIVDPTPNPVDPDPNNPTDPDPNNPSDPIDIGPTGPTKPTQQAIEANSGLGAPLDPPSSEGETIGISVGVVVGLCIIGCVVFAVFKCRKPSEGAGDGEIDPETGHKTPKDKRPSLAMLMNQTTQNPLKNGGVESFVDNQNTEVVKTQMTKEEMLRAEKEKIERLKVQLKENGMDNSEIENQIKQIMDAEKPKYTKEPNESDMSEPAMLDDASSARRLSNVNHANNHTTLKRKTSTRQRDVERIDFELPGNNNALEIDETEMKSLKSDFNFKNKAKLTGVPDLSQVRDSKVGKSVTDDKLIAGTKVNKNPKLETTKGAELGALESVDFDSEKQDNKHSIDIDIDSVADLANDKDKKVSGEPSQNNLRNSIAAPTVGVLQNQKSIVQNVQGAEDKSIQEMSDEDFSDH